MLQDIRFGLRMIIKSKGFTVVVILSLAIGIAASAVVFSVVDAFLFKELPVRDPERLVLFRWFTGLTNTEINAAGTFFRDPSLGRGGAVFSKPAVDEFLKDNRTLSELFTFAPVRLSANLSGQAEIAKGLLVSGNYYSGLGVDAFRGRTMSPQDDVPESPLVAVISHGYWQRRFGLEDSAVGQVIRLNGVGFTIVGITPPEFYGAMKDESPADIQISFSALPHVQQGLLVPIEPARSWIQVMGRLKDKATPEQATANFEPAFVRTTIEGYKLAPGNSRPSARVGTNPTIPIFAVTPGGTGRLQTTASLMRGPLSLLMGIAVLVLVVVCTNVANLMLARGATRQQEINVRLALGSIRWRIIRQLLTESVMLSLMAGAVGILLTFGGVTLLVVLARPDIPIAVDLRILAFTVGLCTVTGILFGLTPALRTTSRRLTSHLANASRTVRGTRSRLSKALLVAQVAVSLILLVGAGLFVRSLQYLTAAQTGFNPENVVVFGVNPGLNLRDNARIQELYEQIVGNVEAIPGVRSATLSNRRLLTPTSNSTAILVRGREFNPNEEVEMVGIRSNYFETLEIPLKLGRAFGPEDTANSPRVVIVNETLARRYFSGANPIGRRFGVSLEQPDLWEIVGVAGDVKLMRLNDEVPAAMYTPYVQYVPMQVFFEVRTAGEPHSFIPAIRRAVGQIDPNLALFNVSTQGDQLQSNFTMFRVAASIASGFGILALFLACVALYSIMSFGVTQRTGEIGVRMALGAQRWDVIRLVASQTATLLSIGLALGSAGSFLLTQGLERQLYEVQPGDPWTLVVAVLVLLGVAVVAGYLPTRRAVCIDPINALHYE